MGEWGGGLRTGESNLTLAFGLATQANDLWCLGLVGLLFVGSVYKMTVRGAYRSTHVVGFSLDGSCCCFHLHQ